MITTSPYHVAERLIGVHELPGLRHNPLIVAMLEVDDPAIQDDETPWCSAFVNFVCHLLGLPRSRSLAARSWLIVGTPIALTEAQADSDIVILSRGHGPQPGADVLDAPGHVGLFAGRPASGLVDLLGGNQGDAVSIAGFPKARVLGVRRLIA